MNKQILNLSLKHNLVLTPQLQQAIKILNMNSLELGQEISQMLAQNFMLNSDSDYTLDSMPEDGENNELETELPLEDVDYDDWDEDLGSDWSEFQPSNSYENNLEEYLSCKQTLSTFLIEQIEQMPIDKDLAEAAITIVYYLEDDGYFRDDLNRLANSYQIPLPLLEQGLETIRECQPSGVGAKDLEDCLNLQINSLPSQTPHLDILKHIMQRYFKFIGKDPALIQQRLSLTEQQYNQAINLLRSLNPAPGHAYNEGHTQFIKPDIIVHEHHGISYIESTDNLKTKLTINKIYAALAEKATGQDKTLLAAQLQEAKWFISALEKRADTIQRVASIVVAMQQDFFQEGEVAMKPLTRQQVAEMLDIHESTVSRAVNGKYLLCKRGLFELRYFFSTYLENTRGADESTTAIKAMIAELISKEDTKKPLSDLQISQLLAQKGHQVARRTISKYREVLNIPASSARRTK